MRLLVLVILFFISCNNNNYNENYQKHINDNSEFIGRKIKLTEKMSVLNNNDNVLNENMSKGLLIFTGSVDCSPCVILLKDIEKFISKNQDLLEYVNIIFVGNGKKNEYFDYQIQKNNFSFPIYLDVDNSFMNENKLMTKSVFLTNPNLEIELFGNFLYNKEVEKLYINTIKNL